MTSYIGIVNKVQDSEYGVFFPDFPGCVTSGPTLDIAYTMAKEALQFHVDGLLEDGENLPMPSGHGDVTDIGENAIGTFMIQIKADSPFKIAA
jgi:predicted RNase H-like HicB family nuclease